MKITLTQQAIKNIRRGYPLIQVEDIQQQISTQQWVTFTDSQGKQIAQGYLGKQNKGVGWVLTLEDSPIDLAFFCERFASAKDRRHSFFQSEQTNAFRLVNGEGDGLGGMTVDWYNQFAVFSWYNETLYHNRELIIQSFQTVFPEVKGAYEKIRFDSMLPESQWIYGEEAAEPLIIKENGIKYATYLNDGLMTGVFLDQREVRSYLSTGFSSGKSLLNMFSYTGAFSVAAAMGGAIQTTSVDLAKRSLARTHEQFHVNGLDVSKQKVHIMDTFDYFKYARKKGLSFDIIVLDPPSFARNKKKVFRVTKNYGELVEDSVAILNNQGVLVASTNAANLSAQKFQQIIELSLQKKAVGFRKIANYRLPDDFMTDPAFPEGNYLKVFFYQIQK